MVEVLVSIYRFCPHCHLQLAALDDIEETDA